MHNLSSRLFFCIPLSFLFVFSACVRRPENQKPSLTDSVPVRDQAIRGYFSSQVVFHTDNNRLDSFFLDHPLLKKYAGDVKEFYGYRQFHFAWYDSGGLTEQANNLYNHLNNLELEGIMTAVPYMKKLDSLLNDPMPQADPDPDLEILLSAEYFFYADKVWAGIPEQTTNKLAWYLPRKRLNLPYMMDSLLKDTAAIFSDNYSNRQYNLLKTQLRKYRQLGGSGPWKLISTPGGALKKNASGNVIREIRHRLYLFGDLDKDSGSDHFDDSLELAVKSFQGRYGMVLDGVAGAAFLRELNTPLNEHIRKLIINMERARWLPIIKDQQYIVINIPAFTLSAYDMDTLSFKMNVVVGKDVHQTVVFNGDIKYIVFSPYWNVPASIMKKEILPALRKNPGYLKKNNMEWAGNGIRQKPGPSNSLGLVKFLFPNSFNIYLHDTPAKSLFGAASRAFSHGCIRVAEPKKLAVYLLKNDHMWNEKKITEAMHAGREKYVTLSHPVPVFIGYMTAWVDNQGKLNFRQDIYKRDKPLAEMLFQN